MKFLIISCFIVCSIQMRAQDQLSYPSSTFCLPVAELERSIEWYKQLLGEIDYFSPADGIIEFALNDNTWLQLFEGELSSSSVLRLEVKDIEFQYKRLKNLKLSPTEIELVPNVVSYFDFKDPDGNQLSFYKLEIN